jgi:hypothetical protein
MGDRIDEAGFRFQLDRVAFGCTSRGQALRDARWALFTENHQTETVTFGTGMEGAQLRPGDIVAVLDPRRAGKSWGGRVREWRGNEVVLDREVELGAGDHSLIVTTAAGRVVEGEVIGPLGATDRLKLFRSDLDTVEGAVWTLASEKTAPELWRVVAVAMDGEGEYTVTALEYAHEKYAWVEEPFEFTDRRKWTGGDMVSPLRPPGGLALREYLYRNGTQGICAGAQAMWAQGKGEVGYLPAYRVDDGNWVVLPATAQLSVEIAPLPSPCLLSFRVCATALDGHASPPAQAGLHVLGSTAPPPDVTGFKVRCADAALLAFEWDPCPDLDFDYYEIREGESWGPEAWRSPRLRDYLDRYSLWDKVYGPGAGNEGDGDADGDGGADETGEGGDADEGGETGEGGEGSEIQFATSVNVTASKLVATGLTANRHTAETGPTREKATFWIKARDASGNWSLNAAKATLNVYTRASLDVLTIDRKQTGKARMLALEAGRAGGGLGLVDVPAIMRTNLNAAYAELDTLLAGAGGDCAWDSLDGPTYLGEGGGAALEAALGNAAAALADLTDAAQRAERAQEIAAAVQPLNTKLAELGTHLTNFDAQLTNFGTQMTAFGTQLSTVIGLVAPTTPP